jgi:hypothetical protein
LSKQPDDVNIAVEDVDHTNCLPVDLEIHTSDKTNKQTNKRPTSNSSLLKDRYSDLSKQPDDVNIAGGRRRSHKFQVHRRYKKKAEDQNEANVQTNTTTGACPLQIQKESK